MLNGFSGSIGVIAELPEPFCNVSIRIVTLRSIESYFGISIPLIEFAKGHIRNRFCVLWFRSRCISTCAAAVLLCGEIPCWACCVYTVVIPSVYLPVICG